jgi:hypothetical protein
MFSLEEKIVKELKFESLDEMIELKKILDSKIERSIKKNIATASFKWKGKRVNIDMTSQEFIFGFIYGSGTC